MKNAISSIEEWRFIQHHSNNSSYSTNSLSSMVSNDDDDDMSCNAVTAEELFDDNFFERNERRSVSCCEYAGCLKLGQLEFGRPKS